MPVQIVFSRGDNKIDVELKVGSCYEVTFLKPTTQKDIKNNGRVVQILGFTDDFMGDVIVRLRYLDNNRRGRVSVNCLVAD